MGKTYKKITKELYLSECKKIASEKSGKCLSNEYLGTHKYLLWECEYGHQWQASPANIKRGKWCPSCSRNKKLSINECKKYANLKGGKCLSDEYINSSSILDWECKYKHRWKSNFNNIKSKGSWCPICCSNVGEKICRLFFEEYFNKPFPKIKPSWLINENGNRLELDGYCTELGIAFEYQGIQHYIIDGFFNRSILDLYKIKNHDELKKKLCKQNNIELFEIKHFNDLTNLEKIKCKLQSKLNKRGFPEKNITLCESDMFSNNIEKYKKIAKFMGGECLSNQYIDYYTKLKWKCEKGHIWDAIGYSIEKGHWCPDCAGNRKKT